MNINLTYSDIYPVLANIQAYAPPAVLTASDILTVVGAVVSKAIPFPKKGNHPPIIKPNAREVWDEVVQTYETQLKDLAKAKGNDHAYAAAVVLLRKKCKLIGIDNPFEVSLLVKQEKKSKSVRYRKMLQTIKRRFDRGIDFAAKLHKALVNEEVVADEPMTACGPYFYKVDRGLGTKHMYIESYFQFNPPSGVGRQKPAGASTLETALMVKLPPKLTFKKVKKDLVHIVNSTDDIPEILYFRLDADGQLIMCLGFTGSEVATLFDGAVTVDAIRDRLTEFGKQHNSNIVHSIEELTR